MSQIAWEVTADDVENVLERFIAEGQYSGEVSEEADGVFDEHMDSGNCDRAVEAALAYTDPDDQALSVYHEIAKILIEERVVQGPNPYEDDLP